VCAVSGVAPADGSSAHESSIPGLRERRSTLREGREGVREARGLAWAPERARRAQQRRPSERDHAYSGRACTWDRAPPRAPQAPRTACSTASPEYRAPPLARRARDHECAVRVHVRRGSSKGTACVEPFGKGLVATHWRPGTKRVQEAIHTQGGGGGRGLTSGVRQPYADALTGTNTHARAPRSFLSPAVRSDTSVRSGSSSW